MPRIGLGRLVPSGGAVGRSSITAKRSQLFAAAVMELRQSQLPVATVERCPAGVYNWRVVQKGQIHAPLRVLSPRLQQTFLKYSDSH